MYFRSQPLSLRHIDVNGAEEVRNNVRRLRIYCIKAMQTFTVIPELLPFVWRFMRAVNWGLQILIGNFLDVLHYRLSDNSLRFPTSLCENSLNYYIGYYTFRIVL